MSNSFIVDKDGFWSLFITSLLIRDTERRDKVFNLSSSDLHPSHAGSYNNSYSHFGDTCRYYFLISSNILSFSNSEVISKFTSYVNSALQHNLKLQRNPFFNFKLQNSVNHTSDYLPLTSLQNELDSILR